LYLQHPFIGDDALEVAMGFLGHSNSEISYQKMNEIKEQSLRLLLFFAVRGGAPKVLGRVAKLLKQSANSCLDASLVRYFIAGLLEVAQAPYSIPFIRSLGALLKSSGCVEAVRTSYFDDENKRRLDTVMKYFVELLDGKKDSSLTPEDTSLVKSVLSIYGTS
jgi:hypothetical protein